MIGILALQGGFLAHKARLSALGIPVAEIRLAQDLENIDALILPGGESTTMLKLMEAFDLFEPLQAFGKTGKPILGTCAGAILMSRDVRVSREGKPCDQKRFGWLPVTIARNAYGSQRESFFTHVDLEPWHASGVPAYFIRAPKFLEVDPEVQILAREDGDIVGVQYKHFSAITFHPELADSTSFHEAWLKQIGYAGDVAA